MLVKVKLMSVINLVATSWKFHNRSRLNGTDKDFKNLNKSALAQRATTAHVSMLLS